MAEGTIRKLVGRGYGFIKTEGDKDLFFHFSAVQDVRFEELQEGREGLLHGGPECERPLAENVKPV